MRTGQRSRKPIQDEHDLIHTMFKRGSSYAVWETRKVYDRRVYVTLNEAALTERIKQALTELRGLGTTMTK